LAHQITLLPGDGIGPEVTNAVTSIIESAGVHVDWESHVVGAEAIERGESDTLPQRVLDSILRNKVALKGPVTTPIGKGFQSVNVRLRKSLDLYANLRPVRTMPNVPTRFENVNLVVVRENTESLYSGLEHEVVPGVVESLKIITEKASTRIAKFALEYARTHNLSMVTAVHKANILKLTSGMFLQIARDLAAQYPHVDFNDRIIDNMCMQLVQKPELYDVLVLPNLYGDILSDLCAGLVGGLGVAPGANIGDHGAVFEATHGSAPKYAGMNRVNPMAMMLSGMLMLKHLGEEKAADRLERAIAAVIKEGKSVTYDMKSRRDDPTAAGTSQVAEAVIEKMNTMF